MKKKPIVIYFVFFFTYILLYTISLIINSQFAMSLTKPGASLLAFVAIAYFTKSISEQKGPIQIIRFAMLVWFLVDFFQLSEKYHAYLPESLLEIFIISN